MSELPRSADAVVIGGGVMGTSTAYHLAKAGMRRVVLLEREEYLGSMSTGQCAGGVRHQFSTEVNIRLSAESIAMLERFPDEPGHEVDLRLCGYLMLLSTPDGVASFRRSLELQNSLGIGTRWVEPAEAAELAPLLDMDGVLGGTFYERDGLADPDGVVQGYVAGARRLGATVLAGTPVTGVRANGRITAVETPPGVIETPVVVNAAGAWAPEIGRMVGVDIPIEPIRRQIVVTTAVPGLPADFPFVVFFEDSLYLHREGEGILTGKSNVEETPGFKMQVDPEWEAVHMEEVMTRMPAIGDAGILSRWAGLYEVTPDANPIFGRIPEVEGLYVMAGFSGHGFMHGPAAGLLMAEEILEGKAHTVDVSEFAFDRFAGGELKPEKNVI